MKRLSWFFACAVLAAGLAGCETTSTVKDLAAPRSVTPTSAVIGQSGRVIVVTARAGDTATGLAQRYLGDASKATRVRALSDPGGQISTFRAGEDVALFLHPLDPGGTLGAAAQRVPILCYHRFTAKERSTSKMEVSASVFEQQVRYLLAQGYHPVSLSALMGFLEGREELPSKAVVITIDDGYRSAYSVAYPVLRRLQVPATLFIYTDFVGTGDALSWAQIAEMSSTRLIDVESHSKTHNDLTQRRKGESPAAYQKRLSLELDGPRNLLTSRTSEPVRFFAFPYGAANSAIIGDLQRDNWALGLTVIRGGNPTWADPLLLKREMIFGSDSLEQFARRLQSAVEASRHP